MDLQNILKEISVGLLQAKGETFKGNPIAKQIRVDLKNKIGVFLKSKNLKGFTVKGSAGSGGWADIPWLSILKNSITNTTQEGFYPVYLFCSDGSGVYLSLALGTTEIKQSYKSVESRNKYIKQVKKSILSKYPDLNKNDWNSSDLDLKANTVLGQSYQTANIVAKYYAANDIPDDSVLFSDLLNLIDIYSQMDISILSDMDNNSLDKLNIEVNTTPIYKSFLLLAGISGTGKTRFVREQAKDNGGNYQLVAVRPDWHEPSDLLGYISRLGNNGPEYITTDVLKFLVKAWKVIADSGLSIETSNNKLQVVGKSDDLKALSPFWLCLDEMNLAPVEQYFADYLSILETREWLWDDTEFTYSSDALLSANIFTDFSGQGLRKSLEMDDSKYDDLWSHFCAVGMPIPFNLIVAGTVNMDETTHGFSRKVIDRALSFDFGEFFPNDFQQVFESKTKNKILSFPIYSHAQLANIRRSTVDPDGQLSIDFLESVNQVLKNTPFELAYRALNELLLSVVAFDPKDKAELQAVWDDFLMCKVLPRIDGDLDKLQGEDGILRKLTDTLSQQLDEIWGEDKSRLDLYRIRVNDSNEAAESDQQNSDENKLSIKCRSKKKLKWMSGRLATAGFTSFWP